MPNPSEELNLPADDLVKVLAREAFKVKESTAKPFELKLRDYDHGVPVENGLTYAYQWTGNKPPLLFVHGWEGRVSQFAGIINKAVDLDHSVVAIDMPGHGKASGHKTNPLQFSRAVQAAGKEFGAFSAVIGHSQGANAVIHAVHRGLQTSRISLISPLTSAETHLRRKCKMLKLDEATTRAFLQSIEDVVEVPTSEFELSNYAQDLRLPVQIIHDRNDQKIPFEDGQALAASLPDAQLMTTERLGHRKILSDRHVINAVLNWVREEEPAT